MVIVVIVVIVVVEEGKGEGGEGGLFLLTKTYYFSIGAAIAGLATDELGRKWIVFLSAFIGFVGL